MEHMEPGAEGAAGPIVFFDGVCNLCNGAVNALLDRDRRGRLRFAPLQGETFAALRSRRPELEQLDSIVVEDRGGLHVKSAAVVHVLRALGGPWPALAWLVRLVPRPLRDRAYDLVAARRYRWFGRRDACRVPTPELKARFLP
jgi:predicted DCC family thiol-disulfide oxidoreductase YuxK